MKLTQDHAGENWHTEDPATLYIKHSGLLSEPPLTLTCFVMNDSLNRGEFIEVMFEHLEFLAAAMFGEGRLSPCGGTTKWIGSAYKHAIYRYKRSVVSSGSIVIIEAHGGGTQGYCINTLTAVETWTHLACALPSEMLWNICHDLCQMYANARYVERQKIHLQFLQGRLKKRRRNNRLHVELVAPTERKP
jgi:hypothetical protein